MGKQARRPKQLEMELPTWGGRREGAGRKPGPGKRKVSHRARPEHRGEHPAHVVLRTRRDLATLRTGRVFRQLRPGLAKAAVRLGMRLVHWSVQGNHFHLIVEAEDREALSRGMQGLAVRLARAVNRAQQRKGTVFEDHYFAHALRTPAEVRHAIRYVENNHALHAERAGRPLAWQGVDPFSTAAPGTPRAEPRTWLLTVGWRRASAGVALAWSAVPA